MNYNINNVKHLMMFAAQKAGIDAETAISRAKAKGMVPMTDAKIVAILAPLGHVPNAEAQDYDGSLAAAIDLVKAMAK